MSGDYLVLVAVAGVGVAYGLFRPRRRTGPSRGGWIGLTVIAFLFVGLLLSSFANNEKLNWLFGLALMAALPIMLFVAIGASIGSFLRGRSSSDMKDL